MIPTHLFGSGIRRIRDIFKPDKCPNDRMLKLRLLSANFAGLEDITGWIESAMMGDLDSITIYWISSCSICSILTPIDWRAKCTRLRDNGCGGATCNEFTTMPYGMYISAEGAQMQARRLEVLANNLANVNTAGFKRDVPTFQARLAEAFEQGVASPGHSPKDDVGGGVTFHGVATDFSPGQMQQTNMPTDLAIVGNGFFQVQSEGGEPLLTRAGNFTVSTQGALLTQDGEHHVLDASGAPIFLVPDQPWHVTTDGYVMQQDTAVGLALVAPESLSDLVKVGNNLFRPLADVEPIALNERHVRSGFLELSSVNPTLEMIQLIETTRAFEANTKIIQHQDDMISSLISRVLQS
ncbi:MAG: flagellar hook basal-body protein [Pirellulales bacterium]|nr:flagellar hook basal-body protein [Pirellulales bacterium]